MQIYLLQWLDSDADFCAQREAFYNKRDAKKKHDELLKEAENNSDLTVGSFEDDCSKCVINDKESLVDLLNSLI